MVRSSRLLTILLLVALLLSACQPIIVPSAASNAGSSPMAQHLQAAYSAGDMAGLTAIMASDAVVHLPPLPDITGIDAYRAAIADLRNALPNATLTFNDLSVSGEQIVTRYTITGTHIAPSVAFGPPTGKAVTLTGVMVAHLQEGQITELWDYADRWGLSLQLDQALPSPPTFVAVNAPAPVGASTLDPALISEVEALMNQVMTEQRQVGMAIGIVMDGEVAYARGFGVADVESGRPVTEHTLFEQGSVSKQFVGAAMMQLVEQGKLKLDDPLVKYLPYFQMKDERAGQITLRHILTHLSGIVTPEPPSMEEGVRALVPEYDAASYERMVRGLSAMELLYDPGQGPFTYSDLAYDILGAVITEVSGQPFEDYMRDHIFLPLGMNDTTFELRATDPTLLARPHVTGTDGKIGKANLFPYTRSNAPCCYLYISVADMARWMAANLHQGALDGVQILQPATHQEMWSPQVVDTGLGEFISAWTSYGIGMFMGDLFGEPVKGAGGTDLGYISYQLIFPEKNMGIVIMANRVDTLDEAFALVPVFEGVMAKIAGITPGSPLFSMDEDGVEPDPHGEFGDQLRPYEQHQISETVDIPSVDDYGRGISTSTAPISVLRCHFTDKVPSKPEQYYNNMFFSTGNGGLRDYFTEMSMGRFNMQVMLKGWYTIPMTLAQAVSFMEDSSLDHGYKRQTMFNKCVDAARRGDGYVPPVGHVVIVMVEPTIDLWGSPGQVFVSGSPQHGSVVHELMHGFGLPHSFRLNILKPCGSWGQAGEYCNQWDIMSWGRTFKNCSLDQFAPCAGVGLNAFHRQQLKWLPAERIQVAAATCTRRVGLAALNHPGAKGPMMLKVPINPADGNSPYYTVEFRRKDGWDHVIPSDIVLIHKVQKGPDGEIVSYLLTDDKEQPLTTIKDGDISINVDLLRPDLNQAWVTVRRKSALPCRLIALQSDLNGKIVRAGITEQTLLAAVSDHILGWETFHLIDLGNGKIAFQSDLNGKIVRAVVTEGRLLAAVSDHILGWETFHLIDLGNGKYALKLDLNGEYVRAGVTAQTYLAAVSDHIGGWETFRIIPIQGVPKP